MDLDSELGFSCCFKSSPALVYALNSQRGCPTDSAHQVSQPLTEAGLVSLILPLGMVCVVVDVEHIVWGS